MSKMSNFSRGAPPPLGCPMEVAAPPRLSGAPPASEICSIRVWSRKDEPAMQGPAQEEASLDSLRAASDTCVLHSLPLLKLLTLLARLEKSTTVAMLASDSSDT